MTRHAAMSIALVDPKGAPVTIAAGEEIPAWAESLVENDAAFVESDAAPEDAYQAPEPEPVEIPTKPDYESMTVAELKEEIARRNAEKPESDQLPDDGKKAELVAALEGDD